MDSKGFNLNKRKKIVNKENTCGVSNLILVSFHLLYKKVIFILSIYIARYKCNMMSVCLSVPKDIAENWTNMVLYKVKHLIGLGNINNYFGGGYH